MIFYITTLHLMPQQDSVMLKYYTVILQCDTMMTEVDTIKP